MLKTKASFEAWRKNRAIVLRYDKPKIFSRFKNLFGKHEITFVLIFNVDDVLMRVRQTRYYYLAIYWLFINSIFRLKITCCIKYLRKQYKIRSVFTNPGIHLSKGIWYNKNRKKRRILYGSLFILTAQIFSWWIMLYRVSWKI